MCDKVIKIGSRKSELALIQTRYVMHQLQTLYPEKKFEIHTMTTVGDRVLNVSLPKIGEKSLFTKDLEDALTTGVVDFVVHSLKDLPTSLPDGMAIGAILEREDPCDALVLRKEFKGKELSTLPDGSVIGTSSLRRSAQLSAQYPNLKVCDVRGNLNTRIAKLDAADSRMTGLLLAKAGLCRMGWHQRIDETLDSTTSLYAVGQGALAVECRAYDTEMIELIAPLSHENTVLRVLAERSFLKRLGGGCSAPVAVSTILHNLDTKSELEIRGAVWSLDGKTKIEDVLKISLLDSDTDRKPSEEIVVSPKRAKVDDSDKESVEDKENAEDIKSCDSCVLSILPIGQDFMGQCPYLEAGHHNKVIGKCPYKISDKESSENCSTENIDITKSVPEDLLNLCPFFNKNKSHPIDTVKDNIKDITKSTNVKLFCGILLQNNIDQILMEKCESLGNQLGDVLIKNGALDVIKSAQAHIKATS